VEKMKSLFVEPFMGISGNMFLGALMDVGVPFDYLKIELEKLNLGEYELVFNRVDKCGINANYFDVKLPEQYHQHEHTAHHEHRNLQDILLIINTSTLPDSVKSQASAVFTKLAEAEAKVHGKTIQEIHFHEVGAIDTIIDIVGSVLAIEYLKIEQIFVSKMQTGKGFVHCAHGIMPVPAPATAELLKHLAHYSGDIDKELVTPTGAALMSTLAQRTDDVPAGFISEKIGYGAGTWDLPIPNVLRVYLGELSALDVNNKLVVAECNIDDMSGQIFPYVMEQVMNIGALDVWTSNIIMKKGRPAHKLSLVCTKELLPVIATLLFRETTTLGIRYYQVERKMLERGFVKVAIDNNVINVKFGKLDGEIVNVAPEFEECKKVAKNTGLPLKKVLAKAAEQGREALDE
jgi:hypothetical protein